MSSVAVPRDASRDCADTVRSQEVLQKPDEGIDIMEAMILGSVGCVAFTSLMLAQVSTNLSDFALYNSLIGGTFGMLVGLCHFGSKDYLDLAKQALSSLALAAFTGGAATRAIVWAFPNFVSPDATSHVMIAGVIGYGGSGILKKLWPKIEEKFVSRTKKKIDEMSDGEE